MIALAALLALILCALPAHAEGSFIPNVRPRLNAPRLEGTISIDGSLDDDGWGNAARAGNFAETSPGDQVRPPVDTEVLVTYDRDHLYLAFIASDPNPSAIRASLRSRDQIFDDDYVGVVIDTYNSTAWCYELYANPYGIQGDLRWTTGDEDAGFDVLFDSRGRITENGYQVEMRIPFKSLRFPNSALQDWRVTFTRVHPRDSERHYSWAAISRDDPCYPCQLGVISGIQDVHPGSSLEFLPAIVGTQSGSLVAPEDPHSGFDRGPLDFDSNDYENLGFALGIRYGFTPSTAAELALNPDFSQVESDVAQIDINTTFALYFPERRPFFQEGSDLFRSSFDLIYTRQINDPSVVGKFTGRSGGAAGVYLFGRDEETPMILPFEDGSLFAAPGKSTSNLARARYNYKEDSYVGALVTDRRYDIGGSGTVASVDGSYRFFTNYRIEAQVAGSYTVEPNDTTLVDVPTDAGFADGSYTATLDGESYYGGAAHVGLAREARHWSSDVNFWEVGPTFRADNGFISRNSERRASWENNYTFYIDNKMWDRIRPTSFVWRRWNSYGTRKGQAMENWVDFRLKGQISLTLGYDISEERFRGVYFNDIDLYYGEFGIEYWKNFQFGFWFGKGDRIARTADPAPFLGEGEHLDFWSTFRLTHRVVIAPILTWSTVRDRETGEDFFNGWIGRVRVNLQFTRELFLRFVTQYDDFEGSLAIEPLLSYQLNPFSVFYIGANVLEQDFDHKSFDPADRTGDGFEPTDWQYFFKFQYFYRM